ncbi:MAG: lamin tail domain-containing protein [Parcubacteria group bacterium]|nr:lamin tail domain-containing protein [Parcubacteria group bacterium]
MTRITEQSIQHVLRRAVVAMLMVGMNAAGLSAVGETFGYYNDTESSEGNVFAAHMLDFRLEATDWTPEESQADLFYGNTGYRDIEILDEATSTDFLYIARANNFSGDTDYCADLNIKAEYDSAEYYHGALTSFASTTPSEDALGTWHYTLHSPVNHQNKICSFDIVYDGWQEEMPGYMQGGYYDTEKVENTISSWGLRINKVYYDVADSLGDEPEHEWVEIFNQTNIPLDISEWKLCDNYSCDTMPTSTPAIPAGGYGVISATSTTWDYWNIPDEVVKIEIDDNSIGNGLANSGDHLLLKRPDGVVIDAVGWGNDTAVWDPAALDVQDGGMLARVPSGHDTDTPEDWSELLPPSVDMLNPDEDDDSQTWYWTYEYTIEWLATNHNGSDTDLSIDLSYIRDINGDEMIDGGDTEHTIATGIGNTGTYDWTVPSGFVGDIWIKLVAYGPENPMVHAFTFSGRVWDPFPMSEPLMSEMPEPEPMPEMEIVGNNPALVALGAGYSDMGAKVFNADGDDMSVHAEGTVDTATEGVYEIVYTAEADGYTLTGTRLVVVYEGDIAPDASEYEVPGVTIVPEESSDDETESTGGSGSGDEGSTDQGDIMTLGGASDSDSNGDGGSDGAGVENGIGSNAGATASDGNATTPLDSVLPDGVATSTPNIVDGSDADDTASTTPPTDTGTASSTPNVATSTDPVAVVATSTDDVATTTSATSTPETGGENPNTSEGAPNAGDTNPLETIEVVAKEEEENPAEAPQGQTDEEVVPEEPEQEEEAPAEEAEGDFPNDPLGDTPPDDTDLPANGGDNA